MLPRKTALDYFPDLHKKKEHQTRWDQQGGLSSYIKKYGLGQSSYRESDCAPHYCHVFNRSTPTHSTIIAFQIETNAFGVAKDQEIGLITLKVAFLDAHDFIEIFRSNLPESMRQKFQALSTDDAFTKYVIGTRSCTYKMYYYGEFIPCYSFKFMEVSTSLDDHRQLIDEFLLAIHRTDKLDKQILVDLDRKFSKLNLNATKLLLTIETNIRKRLNNAYSQGIMFRFFDKLGVPSIVDPIKAYIDEPLTIKNLALTCKEVAFSGANKTVEEHKKILQEYPILRPR
jgi:hypothetical protein